MARIAGIDLPKNKRIDIGLSYIYGIGRFLARQILEEAQVDPARRVKDLTETEISKIASVISSEYRVEGDLRREVHNNINRFKAIGCYKGWRHSHHLPVRGQRTRTNARTKRGKRQRACSDDIIGNIRRR